MPQTKGQNFQDVNQDALPAIGSPARSTNDSTMARIDASLDNPLRMYASFPTANTLLNIRSNMTKAGDGTGRSTGPDDDVIQVFPDTSINFLDGVVTGGSVTVQGASFAFPPTTFGNFRRMVVNYLSGPNTLDVAFSAEAASQAALQDPGELFALLDGIPVGWIDLEAYDSGGATLSFKTPGSVGDTVIDGLIENEVGGISQITLFDPGTASDRADKSFLVQSLVSDLATIKRGTIILDDGRQFYLPDNTVVDLKNDPVSGILAPSANTGYYVYLDLTATALPAPVGVADRLVSTVEASDFVVLADPPESGNVNLERYIPIAAVKTDGSSNYEFYENVALRDHQAPSMAVTPIAEAFPTMSIGSIGSSSNTQGALTTSDFPVPANASTYGLEGDATGTGPVWTELGTSIFDGKGFFGRESVYRTLGSQALVSTDVAFATGAAFTAGAWFNIQGYTASAQIDLLGDWNSTGSLKRWLLEADKAADELRLYTSTDGTAQVFDVILSNFSDYFGKWVNWSVSWDGTDFVVYMNGQPLFTKTTAIHNTGAAQFMLGGRNNAADSAYGLAQEVYYYLGAALTHAQISDLQSKRYTDSEQMAGGHALTDDSFPFSDLTGRAVHYSLATDGTDGSPNSKTLTAVGGAAGGALDIFGVAGSTEFDGSSQAYELTDAFFDINKPFSFGGWFAPKAVAGAAEHWIGRSGGVALLGSRIGVDASGDLVFEMSSDGNTFAIQQVVPQADAYLPGQWVHVAMVWDGRRMIAYLNGAFVVAQDISVVNNPAASFRIGSNSAGAEWYAGRAYGCFFASSALTGEDILKLKSTRIDLTLGGLAPLYQRWIGRFIREDLSYSNELDKGWLLDKKADHVYANFGQDAGDLIDLDVEDLGSNHRVKVAKVFDRVYTADPTGTVAHNLNDVPTDFVVLHNELADGNWAPLNPASHVKGSDTNLTIDAGMLLVDATHPLRIIARVGTKTSVFPDAFGYTMFVNAPFPFAKNYTTLQDALDNAIAGDRILVMGGYSTTQQTTISTDDVHVDFMPNAEVTVNGGTPVAMLSINANRVHVSGARFKLDAAISVDGVSVSATAEDCEVSRARIEGANAGGTIANAYNVITGAARNYLNGSVVATAGTLTNSLTDNGTDTDASIRG